MPKEYIISTSLGFLGFGNKFYQEYPDAKIFPTLSSAKKALRKTPITLNPSHIVIYENYGMEDEVKITLNYGDY